MKKSELLPVFPPCDTETGSEQTAPADLLDVGLLQTFNLLKKKKKMQHVRSSRSYAYPSFIS